MTAILVRDINGTSDFDEEEKINKITSAGWDLVTVVPLNLCRRCYFRKVAVPTPLPEPPVETKHRPPAEWTEEEMLRIAGGKDHQI